MTWQDKVGAKQTSEAYPCGAEHIAAYAKGILESIDGFHELVAPPLVVAKAIIPATGNHLVGLGIEVDLARAVHAGIELAFHRPVRAGDAITCTSTFDGIESKASGQLLSFLFEVHDQERRLVSDGVTRYFVRGNKKREASREARPELGEPDHRRVERVPEGLSLLYAAGSGDTFPIHTDRDFAQMVGLPDVILHGMCTLAIAARAIVDATARGESQRLKRLSVRFCKMVLHGAELETRCWQDGGAVRFETIDQDGVTVLDDGEATVSQ